MPASLKFYSSYTNGSTNTAATQDLSDAKIVIYEDEGGNKYTMDFSGISGLNKIDDIKLSTLKDVDFKYHPSTGPEATVKGLGNIIGALFATQITSGSKSVLAEKVAAKPVVDAILAAVDPNAGNVKIVETELANTFAKTDDIPAMPDLAEYLKTAELKTKVVDKDVVDALVTKLATDTNFAKKVYVKAQDTDEVYTKTEANTAFAKKDGTNVDKVFAKAVFGAKETGTEKLVLVESLEAALSDTTNAVYTGNKTAQAFLGEKGLKPTAAEVAAVEELHTAVASNKTLQDAVRSDVTIQVNADNAAFQGAVHKIMSSDYISDNPLHWDF